MFICNLDRHEYLKPEPFHSHCLANQWRSGRGTRPYILDGLNYLLTPSPAVSGPALYAGRWAGQRIEYLYDLPTGAAEDISQIVYGATWRANLSHETFGQILQRTWYPESQRHAVMPPRKLWLSPLDVYDHLLVTAGDEDILDGRLTALLCHVDPLPAPFRRMLQAVTWNAEEQRAVIPTEALQQALRHYQKTRQQRDQAINAWYRDHFTEKAGPPREPKAKSAKAATQRPRTRRYIGD